MKLPLRIAPALLLSLAAACFGLPVRAQSLALVGGTVYASPEAEPIPDAVVLASDGRIVAVGRRGKIEIPKDASTIDCSGKTVVAGFWNSHVHFTESVWLGAASAAAGPLAAHMQAMLTRWGFTTVWDLGSDPRNSKALRERVNAFEIPGPNILVAGAIYPEGGHPVYLPAEWQLPEAATPRQATQMARDYLGLGLDGIKLFTGAYMGSKPVINMDTAIAEAAVNVAHAQGKPVFAHPQNRAGVEAAIGAGVDVLAHTAPTEADYPADELARFKAQGMALTPTLSLFTTVAKDPAITERLVTSGATQLKTFAANAGTVLFGTDVGFTTLYDTSLELNLMHRALSAREVLASLTTNPARYFKSATKGKIEPGFDADLVVLDGDPLADVGNLAKVATTIRAGRVIYRKQ